MSKLHRHFDEMVWPAPGEAMDELEHRLRYDSVPRAGDQMAAASVIAAYRELIRCTAEKRRRVVRELRNGPSE